MMVKLTKAKVEAELGANAVQYVANRVFSGAEGGSIVVSPSYCSSAAIVPR